MEARKGTMKARRGIFGVFAAVAAAVAALMMASVVPAAAGPEGVTYAVSEAQVVAEHRDISTDSPTNYIYTGEGSCDGCLPPNPVRGEFTLDLQITKYHPNDSGRARRGVGDWEVAWSDGTTSTGSLAFKARGRKIFTLNGVVEGGTNNNFLAKALSGWTTLPPNPVVEASAAMELTFG